MNTALHNDVEELRRTEEVAATLSGRAKSLIAEESCSRADASPVVSGWFDTAANQDIANLRLRSRFGVSLQRAPSLPRSSVGLDMSCTVVSFLTVHAVILQGLNLSTGRTLTLVVAVGMLLAGLAIAGAYHTKTLKDLRSELTTVLAGCCAGFAGVGVFVWTTQAADDVSRAWVLVSMALALATNLGVRVWRSAAFTSSLSRNRQRVLVVGDSVGIQRASLAVAHASSASVRIVASVEVPEIDADELASPADFEDAVSSALQFIEHQRQSDAVIDQVWVALPTHELFRVSQISERLSDTTVDLCVLGDEPMQEILNGTVDRHGFAKVVNLSEVALSPESKQLKRVFDVLLSAVGLAVLALPMAVIAGIVKLDSPGPVLFRQKRYGIDGRAIDVWKFRSMVVHDDAAVVQATRSDARVTKVGRLLRRSSLDELPQLINVLQGSMSLVGPRPHAVAHNERWRREITGYMLRHKVRPGITGWAQVNGWRGETDTPEKMTQRVRYDLDYIRNWSLWLDVRIIAKTVINCVFDKNAY